MPEKTKILNTFIIPCLNNVEGLIKTVESYYKFTEPNFRVIVVFNGTMSDYLTAVAALEEKVHIWIKPYKNLGFGKSMNEGIRLADTEFVTIANDDCEVLYPEWWAETMEIFNENPRIMGFNPHSYINKRNTGERVLQLPKTVEEKAEFTTEDIKAIKELFRNERSYSGLVCTFFTICKKALFDKIGLYDESFGLGSGEDYDLCVRATRAGFLISGGSRVMVKHWWGATKDNLPKDDSFTSNFELIKKGNQRMTEKWGPHCQEIDRQVESGKMSVKQKEELKGGWPNGGAETPLDQAMHHYEGPEKWWEVVEL